MEWLFDDASWEQDDNAQIFKLKSICGEECASEPMSSKGHKIQGATEN